MDNRKSRGNLNPSPETRWKPGQSGNPSGRSVRRTLAQMLVQKLREVAHSTDTTKAEMLVDMVIGMALSGDVTLMKLIFAYDSGMPRQAVDITVREQAERIAAVAGVDADELLAEADRIIAEASGRG